MAGCPTNFPIINTAPPAGLCGHAYKRLWLKIAVAALGLASPITVYSPAQADDGVLASAGERVVDPAGLLGSGPASIGFSTRMPDTSGVDLKGWEYLYSELRKAGIDHQTLVRLFTDRRMPARETLYFGLNPKESKHLYRKHNSKIARKHAVAFYKEHADVFAKAEKQFGVPKSIILAILQVETGCGGNTGSSRVFYQLARLSVAAEPANIDKNLSRFPQPQQPRVMSQVVSRAQYLRDTFLPHVAGTIRLSERLKIDPLELRGSSAGAVGLGQFLPGNVISLGVDGNGDSFVDPYSEADSIMSVANFLKHHGWKEKGSTNKEKRGVIWHYNRSDAYIDTVLAMSRALEPQLCTGDKCSKTKGPRMTSMSPAGRRMPAVVKPASSPRTKPASPAELKKSL